MVLIYFNCKNFFLSLPLNKEMKIFASILSFYVVILTFIPCIDVPTDDSMQKIELSESSADQHHHDTDSCSPFCTCDCCASPVLNHNNTIQFKCVEISQHTFSEYNSSFVSSTFVSIWQPPKLS